MLEVTSETTADRVRTWTALTAVTDWPHWTASMTTVEPLDSGPLGPGSRVRIKQPGMPALVWTITDFREGVEFTWAAASPGIRTVAGHRLDPTPEGGTRITLAIDQSGALAPLVRALTGRRTERYVRMEAAGLAAAAERALPD
ncbi:polyketide cyclase [Nocardia sp. ET3-3]|uniref:Polyketide cyclase n=1 Tax=Nocardia terrae TaxID=2675851 RepID=A0A7K1V1W0_9NOCA|nr:SRPBCC family protein [Nocardia terrae]MVU80595.1 polyketide cyclase [Nocardia terrae]